MVNALALAPPSHAPEAPAGAAAPSFEAIYEEHFDFVWRSLRRLGVPEAGADDAVQDVFLAVYRRLGEFEGRSSIKTWLFGFALRVARDARRRAARKGTPEPLEATLADRAPSPLEQVEQARALRLFDDALGELDDDRRAVFVMGEIEGMTAPEMAEVLGIKLNTAYSRLRLARRDLEAALARRRGGDGEPR
jgi:RNA polymerase sigma-70 factor (ECF subfamily)